MIPDSVFVIFIVSIVYVVAIDVYKRQEQVLYRFNQTQVTHYQKDTVYEEFSYKALENPGRAAMIAGGQRETYGCLLYTSGMYWFDYLAPCKYVVEFDVSLLVNDEGIYEYAFTKPGQGVSGVDDSDAKHPEDPVSYTHLDVYKRQVWVCSRASAT